MRVRGHPHPGRADADWLDFSIHGRLQIRVRRDSPSAGRFTEWFGPFLTGSIEGADIVVDGPARPLTAPARIKWRYRYDASALADVEAGWQVELDEACARITGRGDLFRVALPVVDVLLARRGVALLHAGSAAVAGVGICVAAAGGTGKTSAAARLARLPEARFMGDDLALLTRDARLLAFPKRIWVKSHHRDAYGGALRAARRRPLPFRATQRLLMPRLGPLLGRYPRLRDWGKNLSPLLPAVPVDPETALGVKIASEAPLRLLLLVESVEQRHSQLSEIALETLVSRLLGQFHADVLRDSHDVVAALASTGLVPLDGHLAAKAGVLREALAGVPAHLFRVPAALSKDQAAGVLAEMVATLLDRSPGPPRTPGSPPAPPPSPPRKAVLRPRRAPEAPTADPT